MQKIGEFHLCILEIHSHIRFQRPDWPHPYFDHDRPKVFRTTFNFCEFLSTCKGEIVDLKIDWLAESILASISQTRFFLNIGFVQPHRK